MSAMKQQTDEDNAVACIGAVFLTAVAAIVVVAGIIIWKVMQ